MNNVSIKIHNKEHFKAVQERLFELGFEWPTHPFQEVKHLDQDIKTVSTGYNSFYKSKRDALGDNSTKWVTLDDLYDVISVFKTEITSESGTHYPVTESSDRYLSIGCSTFAVETIYQMMTEYNFYKNNPKK